MKITILTLFPKMFKGFLTESIIGRAINEGILEVEILNLRDWGVGSRKKVDDTPYGGGSGMVLKPDVVVGAIKEIRKGSKRKQKIILMTPQGKLFKQKMAREYSQELSSGKNDLVFVCGHYEGFDERIRDFVDEEVSIGDYILTGGELPAAVISDAVIRLIPGVLGKEESHKNESFEQVTLEYPQYTKPPEFEGLCVPEVLTNGHHAEIAKWRREEAIKRTKKRRPDLLS